MLHHAATRPRSTVSHRWRRRLLVARWTWPPGHEDFSHALDRGGVGAPAHLIKHGPAGHAVISARTNLDQLVGGERAIDLAHDGVGEPFMTNLDERLQGMSSGLQVDTFSGGQ